MTEVDSNQQSISRGKGEITEGTKTFQTTTKKVKVFLVFVFLRISCHAEQFSRGNWGTSVGRQTPVEETKATIQALVGQDVERKSILKLSQLSKALQKITIDHTED